MFASYRQSRYPLHSPACFSGLFHGHPCRANMSPVGNRYPRSTKCHALFPPQTDFFGKYTNKRDSIRDQKSGCTPDEPLEHLCFLHDFRLKKATENGQARFKNSSEFQKSSKQKMAKEQNRSPDNQIQICYSKLHQSANVKNENTSAHVDKGPESVSDLISQKLVRPVPRKRIRKPHQAPLKFGRRGECKHFRSCHTPPAFWASCLCNLWIPTWPFWFYFPSFCQCNYHWLCSSMPLPKMAGSECVSNINSCLQTSSKSRVENQLLAKRAQPGDSRVAKLDEHFPKDPNSDAKVTEINCKIRMPRWTRAKLGAKNSLADATGFCSRELMQSARSFQEKSRQRRYQHKTIPKSINPDDSRESPRDDALLSASKSHKKSEVALNLESEYHSKQAQVAKLLSQMRRIESQLTRSEDALFKKSDPDSDTNTGKSPRKNPEFPANAESWILPATQSRPTLREPYVLGLPSQYILVKFTREKTREPVQPCANLAKYFQRLQPTLEKVIWGEHVGQAQLDSLTKRDRRIVTAVLLKKKFATCEAEVAFDELRFNKLTRRRGSKRSEENLKRVFKLVQKFLRTRFRHSHASFRFRRRDAHLKQKDLVDLGFYTFYFGEVADREGLPIAKFFHPKVFTRRESAICASLDQPDSRPKTINREYIANLRKSRMFLRHMTMYLRNRYRLEDQSCAGVIPDYRRLSRDKIVQKLNLWCRLLEVHGSKKGLRRILADLAVGQKGQLPWSLREMQLAVEETCSYFSISLDEKSDC